MVLISAGNALMRKMFNISSNAWLEVQWYLFGAVFLLAGAYTLLRNEHVRIDFISNMLTKRTRDWIDLICHITFLLPFTILITWLAFPWFLRSFNSGEISANAGGLIIWPAKLFVLLGFLLLTLQGFSEVIKRWAVIQGILDEPNESHTASAQIQEMLGGTSKEQAK